MHAMSICAQLAYLEALIRTHLNKNGLAKHRGFERDEALEAEPYRYMASAEGRVAAGATVLQQPSLSTAYKITVFIEMGSLSDQHQSRKILK